MNICIGESMVENIQDESSSKETTETTEIFEING